MQMRAERQADRNVKKKEKKNKKKNKGDPVKTYVPEFRSSNILAIKKVPINAKKILRNVPIP